MGDLHRKNNAGKVNACLVETAEQHVAFGHGGLRSSSGQSALRSPRLLVFTRTASACRVISELR